MSVRHDLLDGAPIIEPSRSEDRTSYERLIERRGHSDPDLVRADAPCAHPAAEGAGVAADAAAMNEELRETIRVRDEIMSVVSHDLRGALLGIRLHAQLIKEGAAGHRADMSKTAEAILQAVAHMSHLLDDLLRAAAIEAGTFDIAARPQAILPIVGDLLTMLRPVANARGIAIEAAVPAGLPRILCDREQLLRVLCNLTGNAIKFGRERGSVRLSTYATKTEVRFAVSDDGPGLPEDYVPRLFERYRTSGPASRRGIGLGLFISRGIVEAHGGRIWVETRAGAGTTFYFTVPVVEAT